MIDLHCHILPGIDDGARNWEETLKMLYIAKRDGIDKIVATPHYIDDDVYCATSQQTAMLIERINILSKENDIGIEILPGNEVYISVNLPELLESKKVNTINNTQYLLIELPLFDIPQYVIDVIFKLELMGIIPIIAHPERYRKIIDNPFIMARFLEMGVLCQINGESITGRFGGVVKETADALLRNKMVQLVSSDAHSEHMRTPELKSAYDHVKKDFGKEYADEIFIENPAKIIEGKHIEIRKPKRMIKRSNIYKLLRAAKLI